MYTSVLFAAAAALSAPASAGASSGASVQDTTSTVITDPQQRAQALQDIQEMKARIGRIESALGVPSTLHIQYTPAAPGSPRITISSCMVSSTWMRFRILIESIPTGTRRCVRLESLRPRANSAVTDNPFLAFVSHVSARRPQGHSRASHTRPSLNSTSTEQASTPAKPRCASGMHTRAGVRSSRGKPTPCSWTAISSPMSSIIGDRQAWCSCAIRKSGGRSGTKTAGRPPSRLSTSLTISTPAIFG